VPEQEVDRRDVLHAPLLLLQVCLHVLGSIFINFIFDDLGDVD
jgi:hypothetical protein